VLSGEPSHYDWDEGCLVRNKKNIYYLWKKYDGVEMRDFAVNIFVETFIVDKFFNQIFDKFFNQIFDQFSNQIFDQFSNQIFDQFFNQIFDQFFNQIFDQFFNQIFDQFFNQIFDQFFNQTFQVKKSQIPASPIPNKKSNGNDVIRPRDREQIHFGFSITKISLSFFLNKKDTC
jgi:hypothetical protein